VFIRATLFPYALLTFADVICGRCGQALLSRSDVGLPSRSSRVCDCWCSSLSVDVPLFPLLRRQAFLVCGLDPSSLPRFRSFIAFATEKLFCDGSPRIVHISPLLELLIPPPDLGRYIWFPVFWCDTSCLVGRRLSQQACIFSSSCSPPYVWGTFTIYYGPLPTVSSFWSPPSGVVHVSTYNIEFALFCSPVGT